MPTRSAVRMIVAKPRAARMLSVRRMMSSPVTAARSPVAAVDEITTNL